MEHEGNGRKEKDYSSEILNSLMSLNREVSAFHNEISMRLGRLEEHFGKMMGRLGQVENRLTLVEAHLVTMEERASRQEAFLTTARQEAKDAKAEARAIRQDEQRRNGNYTQLEERLRALEILQRSRVI